MQKAVPCAFQQLACSELAVTLKVQQVVPCAVLLLKPCVVVAQEPQEHSEQVMGLVVFEMEKEPVQLVAAQLPEMGFEQGRDPVLGTDLLEGMVSEPISALELGWLELVGISKKPEA